MDAKPNAERKQLHMYLSPELYAAIKRAADADQRPVSLWVRRTCEAALRKNGK